ncbi:MAG TPA: hypothetical protein VIK02_05380 [Candidatus Anoxymicrobiaceae bacterium]|jgi:hypothetical protein
MFTADSTRRIANKVIDVALTVVIVAFVIGICFVAVKYLAVFAGIACLVLSIANLTLRYIPVRAKQTAA